MIADFFSLEILIWVLVGMAILGVLASWSMPEAEKMALAEE